MLKHVSVAWRSVLAGAVLMGCATLPRMAAAADWPWYQADPRRSGVTSETLAFPLSVMWEYRSAARPAPAWPEPGRTMHLMDFDYAFQPVAAGGIVYFGSSADDTVRAIDQKSGRVRWHFTTRGPIRFAPHIADGRCYVASDDGYAYCLDAATGKLVWEFRAAPSGRQALGNERMISRSPCRSGVLVADGVAYVTAGMWPSEGVAVYALEAASGKVLWCNDTNGSLYLGHPHASASFGGPAPQGYLLASQDVLVVPTGQVAPAGFDRKTGRLNFCQETPGGSWATIIDDLFFTQKIKAVNADRDVTHLGENGPMDGDGLEGHSLATGEPQWKPAEAYKALTDKGGTGRKEEGIKQGLVNRQLILGQGKILYTFGGGVAEAIDCSDATKLRTIWSVKQPRAYSAVLAGDTLLAGYGGGVRALRISDGQEVWQATVDGQVRGLAVSNGQLIATTEKGTLVAFGSGAAAPVATDGPTPATESPEPEILKAIPGARSLKGYALVVGESDARLAEAIASHTQLHVICVLTDPAKVAAERERLVLQTSLHGRVQATLYGRRVVVQQANEGELLPYGPYFANVVVVSGKGGGVPASEFYRVLRPCGGRMVFVGDARAQAGKMVEEAGVPKAEGISSDGGVAVVRGKLEGAFDWDSKVTSDQRVKWPLELLWFGGPGPNRMVARHWKAPTPVFANGRYFALGQYHIIAVDAYNGTELWSRQIGGNSGYKIQKVAADDRNVYLNFPDYTVKFDAQTGAIEKVYGTLKESPRLMLDQPAVVPMKQLTTQLGAITITKTAAALELAVEQTAPDAAPNDTWQLHFDFRSVEQQLAGDGPGAFRILLAPADGAWRPGLGGPVPRLTGVRQVPAGGNKVLVTIPWESLREVAGGDPAEFRFAATLQRDEPKQPTQKLHAYADGLATFINDGWATVVLDAARAHPAGQALPVAMGKLEELPAYTRDWPRQPPQYTAEWTIDTYDKLELREWPPLDRDGAPTTRSNPLSGKPTWRNYIKSHGCGGTVASAVTDFFRSGTVGIYDRMDDSGLRNFAAIRPGCGTTMLPVGGLLVSSEGQADCTCSFNFQTSFALAPAAVRRNEDWALFDASLSTSLIRGAALNLGAPGDRRDEQGVLWLGYPRPPFALGKDGPAKKEGKKYTFGLPCELEFAGGFGPYRTNADRVAVRGTDRPWIYASGAQGLRKATLDLLFGEPDSLLAVETKQAPKVDGVLDDACWNGVAPVEVADEKMTVYVRHDAEKLYIAARRQGGGNKDGTPPLQITLRQEGQPRFARLGVMADGTHRSARWDCALDIPKLDKVVIDGKADEWQVGGLPLKLAAGGACRIGWNDEGLVMLTELPREFSVQTPELTGLMALVVQPETWSFLQMAVDARAQSSVLDQRLRKAEVRPAPPVARNVNGLMHWGHPYGELADAGAAFRSAETKTDKVVVVETLFPWSALRIKPVAGTEVPFQVMFYDPKKVNPKFPQGGDWRWQVLAEAKTLGRLRLAAKAGTAQDRTVPVNQRNGCALACVLQQDAGWNPAWSSAAKADGDALVFEAAIPWSSLATAGIDREHLKIALGDSGKIAGPASQVSQEFDRSARVINWEQPVAAQRPYLVRLHFCELNDVRPGDRVFDVKLQGKTVLSGLDVLQAAGARNTALVKEFTGIMADKAITLELVPKSGELTERTAPILSGIEVLEQ